MMVHGRARKFEIGGAAFPAMLAIDEVDDVDRMFGGQCCEFAVKVKLTLAEGIPHVDQECVAKSRAEDFYRKEKRASGSDPTRAVRSDTATRHHTVNVRVEVKVLSPGMQHGQKTDGRTQALGVRRNRQQSLRNGSEQDGVDGSGIL